MERPIGSQLFVKGSGLRDGHLGSSSDSLESLSSIQTQASNFTENKDEDFCNIISNFEAALNHRIDVNEPESSKSSTSTCYSAGNPIKRSQVEYKKDVCTKNLARFRDQMEKMTINSKVEEMVGYDEVRMHIEQAFLNNALASDLRWKAILLVSIPGLGKSKLMSSSAAMVAKLIKQPVSYFYVTTGDLFQKYYGESEKAPQALYQVAREEQPSIVVIDEVDGIMRKRGANDSDQSRRSKTALLAQMEGVHNNSGVLTICSTNRGGDLDSAFVRRFSKIFCISPPNKEERQQILLKFISLFNNFNDVNFLKIDFELVSSITEGFTGDDLKKLVTIAANRNCKVEVDGKLENMENIKSFRHILVSSPSPPKVVPLPIETCHLVEAVKEVGLTYKISDVREIENFKIEHRLTDKTKKTDGIPSAEMENMPGKDIEEIWDVTDDYCCGIHKLCNPC